MTWIKTVPISEADEKLRNAVEAQKALCPIEYAEPVHPTPDAQTSDIVAPHSIIPEALHHAFATFGVSGPAETKSIITAASWVSEARVQAL